MEKQAQALSKDNRIAVGEADGTVKVLGAVTSDPLFSAPGHAGRVSALAWSPDGRLLASGGEDHLVRVWDVSEGGLVYTFEEHTRPVTVISWSPDGRSIASGAGLEVKHWSVAVLAA